MVTDRGQAHTLEGVAAAVLVLSAILIALQMTAVTPLSTGTAAQNVRTQYDRATTGVLAIAADRGAIRPTLLYWNESRSAFHGTTAYYVARPSPTAFGDLLESTFGDRGVAYNVVLTYVTTDGDLGKRRLVYHGEPTDAAVTTRRTVVLYDTDRLLSDTGVETATTLAETSYFAPDAHPGHLYNVVTVEVTVWRT
ncbi:MAG: hypothetical protein ABEJ77_05925 [Halanaeroarchaeum sp.]